MRVNNEKRTELPAGRDSPHQTQSSVNPSQSVPQASTDSASRARDYNDTVHRPLSEAERVRIQQRQRQRLQQAESQGRRKLARSSAGRAIEGSPDPLHETAIPSDPSLLDELFQAYQIERHPYPEDVPLIDKFSMGAELGNSHYPTVKNYRNRLTYFSDWLREQNKGSISQRLFDPELDRQVKAFAYDSRYTETASALQYLRASFLDPHGKVSIARRKLDERLAIPPEDHWLIKQAFPEKKTSRQRKYIDILMHLSEWLTTQHNLTLCEFMGRDPASFQESIQDFTGIQTEQHAHLRSALNHLRQLDAGQTVAIRKFHTRDEAHPDDRELLIEFEKRLEQQVIEQANRAGKEVKRDRAGRTLAYGYASKLRRFSIWLRQQGKPSLASRIHFGSVEMDRDLWLEGKHKNSFNAINTPLRRLRELFPASLPTVRQGELEGPSEANVGSPSSSAAPSESLFAGLSPLIADFNAVPEGEPHQMAAGNAASPSSSAAPSESLFADLSPLIADFNAVPEGEPHQMAAGNAASPSSSAATSESLFADLSPLIADFNAVPEGEPHQMAAGNAASPSSSAAPSESLFAGLSPLIADFNADPEGEPHQMAAGNAASPSSSAAPSESLFAGLSPLIADFNAVPEGEPHQMAAGNAASPSSSAAPSESLFAGLSPLIADFNAVPEGEPNPMAAGNAASPSSSAAPSESLFAGLSPLIADFNADPEGEPNQMAAGNADNPTAPSDSSFSSRPLARSDFETNPLSSRQVGAQSNSRVVLPARSSFFSGLSSIERRLTDYDPRSPEEVTGPLSQSQTASRPLSSPLRDQTLSRAAASSTLAQLLQQSALNSMQPGYASGRGLSCLLDSILQIYHGIRRYPNQHNSELQLLEREVDRIRQHILVPLGMAGQQGPIDVYGGSGELLASNLGIRLHLVQLQANGQLRYHPVFGQGSKAVWILHTPGHFIPLWPR